MTKKFENIELEKVTVVELLERFPPSKWRWIDNDDGICYDPWAVMNGPRHEMNIYGLDKEPTEVFLYRHNESDTEPYQCNQESWYVYENMDAARAALPFFCIKPVSEMQHRRIEHLGKRDLKDIIRNLRREHRLLQKAFDKLNSAQCGGSHD